MARAQVHYEVFARRSAVADWTLQGACEDRDRALETAEAMLRHREALAVRVTKEILDPDTRQFRSFVILTKGSLDSQLKRPRLTPTVEPPCVEPGDLYSVHARERIARLLEAWLARRRITPYELLHRPDLAEQLEASGLELQHALQKVAIPEAQASGVTVHGVMRAYMPLVERALARVITDGRRGWFADLSSESFAVACTRLADQPERAYRLAGGVCGDLAAARSWAGKVERLLDLADAAPREGELRAFALSVLEAPLAEAMESRAGLADLLGADLDLGAALAALTRLSASDAVEALLAIDPGLRRRFPSLSGTAARLAAWFDAGVFEAVRLALVRRVLTELKSKRRLRPGDAEGEIDILRALAMGLTAAAGPQLPLDAISEAFAERSRRLVSADFVEDLLANRHGALDEARALLWLADNVTGAANKRAAARWLSSCVGAMRFETEMRAGPDAPTVKLETLAALQREVIKADLTDADGLAVLRRLGEVGGWVEADAHLTAAIARASAPAAHRLTLLFRLAAGEAGPSGPVADRARLEAHRLLRRDDVRIELATDPEAQKRIRSWLEGSPLAA